MVRRLILGVWCLAAGCGPESSATPPATPEQLAVRAAADFGANEAGVVTPDRLAHWLADWEAHRPAGVEGELVVLQFDAAPGSSP